MLVQSVLACQGESGSRWSKLFEVQNSQSYYTVGEWVKLVRLKLDGSRGGFSKARPHLFVLQ